MACILTLARFCAPSSELQIGRLSGTAKRHWTTCFGVADREGQRRPSCTALSTLCFPRRTNSLATCKKLTASCSARRYDLLLYDITSTYFEGTGAANPQARRGYSRDKRPDCVQVCIGLVVTPEGLPLAYEVFDGNRTDVTTVDEIVETMRDEVRPRAARLGDGSRDGQRRES